MFISDHLSQQQTKSKEKNYIQSVRAKVGSRLKVQ